MRVEHEYRRGGTLAYLAAWDVARVKIFGRCEPSSGIEPFDRRVDQVMTTEPYASARHVYWIVDDGSSHRGHTAAHRLSTRRPTLRLVHLPVRASWLNHVRARLHRLVRQARRRPGRPHTTGPPEQVYLDWDDYQHRHQSTG